MSKLGKIVGEKNVVLTARREKSEVGKLLKELAKKGENQMPMFTAEDSYSCFCDY